jgi:hypothetical protein
MATQNAAASKATPVLTWNVPASIVYGSALGNGQLNATASVAGVFAYNPPAGTVLPVGNAQTLSVTFTPADTLDYLATSATTTISVAAPAPPPVSAPASPPNLVLTRVLTRSGGNIVAQIAIANNGGSGAVNVVLSSVKVGTTAASPTPQSLGDIAAGASATATVMVPGTVGISGAASSLSVSGSYVGGTFNQTARITLP